MLFVSYMNDDLKAANDIVTLFQSNDADVWQDRKRIHAGASWRNQIVSALEQCDFFVPLFSNSYAARRRSYFNREVKMALAMMDEVHSGQQWILPIRLDDSVIPDIVVGEYRIRDFQFVDVFGENPSRELIRFLKDIGVEQPDLSAISEDGKPRIRLAAPA